MDISLAWMQYMHTCNVFNRGPTIQRFLSGVAETRHQAANYSWPSFNLDSLATACLGSNQSFWKCALCFKPCHVLINHQLHSITIGTIKPPPRTRQTKKKHKPLRCYTKDTSRRGRVVEWFCEQTQQENALTPKQRLEWRTRHTDSVSSTSDILMYLCFPEDTRHTVPLPV